MSKISNAGSLENYKGEVINFYFSRFPGIMKEEKDEYLLRLFQNTTGARGKFEEFKVTDDTFLYEQGDGYYCEKGHKWGNDIQDVFFKIILAHEVYNRREVQISHNYLNSLNSSGYIAETLKYQSIEGMLENIYQEYLLVVQTPTKSIRSSGRFRNASGSGNYRTTASGNYGTSISGNYETTNNGNYKKRGRGSFPSIGRF